MFKILAPFVSAGELDALKSAGVDELFCGFVDRESEKKWPIYYSTINRRSRGASFDDVDVFASAVQKAHRLSLPVFLTLNGLYTHSQYPWLRRIADLTVRLPGVRGLIVSDIGLLLDLRRRSYPKEVHISTGGSTFNPLTVNFFVSLGADRIILDRQLCTEEMLEIVRSQQRRQVMFELFILRSACPFVDGYCTFLHTCGVTKKSTVRPGLTIVHDTKQVPLGCSHVLSALRHRRFRVCSPGGSPVRIRFSFDQAKAQLRGCNLCALYRLRGRGTLALKVLERGTNTAGLVAVVREAVALVEQGGLSEAEYCRHARRLFRKAFGMPCRGLNCYCPPGMVSQRL